MAEGGALTAVFGLPGPEEDGGRRALGGSQGAGAAGIGPIEQLQLDAVAADGLSEARPAGSEARDDTLAAGEAWFRRASAAYRPDLVVTFDGTELATACVMRGWSFSELARRAGISRPTLHAALNGHTLRPSTAWRIRWALGQGPVLPLPAEPVQLPST